MRKTWAETKESGEIESDVREGIVSRRRCSASEERRGTDDDDDDDDDEWKQDEKQTGHRETTRPVKNKRNGENRAKRGRGLSHSSLECKSSLPTERGTASMPAGVR